VLSTLVTPIMADASLGGRLVRWPAGCPPAQPGSSRRMQKLEGLAAHVIGAHVGARIPARSEAQRWQWPRPCGQRQFSKIRFVPIRQGQQAWPSAYVDLVGAGVVEVFAHSAQRRCRPPRGDWLVGGESPSSLSGWAGHVGYAAGDPGGRVKADRPRPPLLPFQLPRAGIAFSARTGAEADRGRPPWRTDAARGGIRMTEGALLVTERA